METITVYRDTYNSLQDNEFRLMTELAQLKGTVRALAEMDDHTDFVMQRLKEIVEKDKKEVDTAA